MQEDGLKMAANELLQLKIELHDHVVGASRCKYRDQRQNDGFCQAVQLK